MTGRPRPSRAQMRDLEAVTAELIAAIDQETFRRISFRHRPSERTRAAMQAARELVPPRPEPVKPTPMQPEARG